MKVCYFSCCVALWVGAFAPGQLHGAEGEETHIHSQTMTAKSKERRAIFKGAVVLTQGELIVHSDIMVVWWKPSEQSHQDKLIGSETKSSNKIERVVATGKVRIEKPSGRAVCRQAVYFKDEDKLVLTGSPIAWQDGTRVSGTKMTMYLKEDRSEVEGETR
ncbi:MAG: LptA/OstA family protein, partial [Nitrospirales bacterium]